MRSVYQQKNGYIVELYRGRDSAGAGAWRSAPALYRGRGLKFLFCTHKNEIFSASKILKTAKKALKIEPKVKKHIVR